jgi:hypothetical protein
MDKIKPYKSPFDEVETDLSMMNLEPSNDDRGKDIFKRVFESYSKFFEVFDKAMMKNPKSVPLELFNARIALMFEQLTLQFEATEYAEELLKEQENDTER